MSFAKFLFNAVKAGSLSENSDDNVNWHEKIAIIYNEKGAAFETRPEWRNVMAIRSFTTVSKNSQRGVFDNAIIIAWSSNNGETLNWRGFSANTDPSFQYMQGRNDGVRKDLVRPGKSDEGLDADGDGRKDLGMLPPGAYQYNITPSAAANTVLGLVFKPVRDQNNPSGLRVFRDIDRDGQFTDADEKLIKNPAAMYENYTMYIHRASKKQNLIIHGRQVVKLCDLKILRSLRKIWRTEQSRGKSFLLTF